MHRLDCSQSCNHIWHGRHEGKPDEQEACDEKPPEVRAVGVAALSKDIVVVSLVAGDARAVEIFALE